MKRWLIPCNPNYYDIDGAFNELKRIDYKQSAKKVNVGDYVYIYVSKPVMAIKYLCKVNKINMDKIEIDDSKFVLNGDPYEVYPVHMQLELVKKFDNELTREVMSRYGVKGNIQGPRSLALELCSYIEENGLDN